MSNTETMEVQEQAHNSGKKEVIRITIYLTVITLVELALGFLMMPWDEGSFKRHFVKGVIIILMLWKGFYIAGYFMHLRHENKIFKTVVMLPLLLFVWFIIAFLADGASFLNLRRTYDPYSIELSKQKAPEHGEHGQEKPVENNPVHE